MFALNWSPRLRNSEVKMQNVWDSMNQVKSQWLVQLNLIPMVCVTINCQKAWSQEVGWKKECPYSSLAKKFSVPLKEKTGTFGAVSQCSKNWEERASPNNPRCLPNPNSTPTPPSVSINECHFSCSRLDPGGMGGWSRKGEEKQMQNTSQTHF